MIPLSEVAYAAGIFDGEGSMAAYLGAGVNSRSLVYCCSVWQNSNELLEWFVPRFGGSITRRNGSGYGKGGNKSSGEWRVTTAKASEFLSTIRPMLVVRARDVDIMLRIWRVRFDRQVLQEALDLRKQLRTALSSEVQEITDHILSLNSTLPKEDYETTLLRSKASRRRFTNEEVLEIRRRRASGEGPYSIARSFKAGINTIYGVLKGETKIYTVGDLA